MQKKENGAKDFFFIDHILFAKSGIYCAIINGRCGTEHTADVCFVLDPLTPRSKTPDRMHVCFCDVTDLGSGR